MWFATKYDSKQQILLISLDNRVGFSRPGYKANSSFLLNNALYLFEWYLIGYW